MRNICLGFGGPLLLSQISLQIEQGERVCLMGRNGTGKSTLMKIIKGDMLPDKGDILRQPGMSVAYLDQEVPKGLRGTISDVVMSGLGDHGDSSGNDEEWQRQQAVEEIVSRMRLNRDADFDSLSAGVKRRALLARALVCRPGLLLLDEPTNHLDISTITGMEDFLLRHVKTLLFVTHDRMFLQKLATRIIELDRGSLFNWSCDYPTYLERRQSDIETEEKQHSAFDKKLAEEEAWLRKGLRARRTRNEGRVSALEKMREIRHARMARTGTPQMQAQEAERTGKLVIEARNISHNYGGQAIISDFSVAIMRRDKVGIIGPNGCGKSTLLQILLEKLSPAQGKVRHGTRLEISYFDQLRAQLDENKNVEENVGDGNDNVIINGRPRHIIGYLKDFLFTPERSRSPVRILSGGERNRLLLAKLFTKPSNVLVLDEPTNDLDAETLELLEELLADYSGTLLLVSHDRAFLNNVVSSTLVFEDRGNIGEYAGGYDDWLLQRKSEKAPDKSEKVLIRKEKPRPRNNRPRKLNYKEQRELEGLPARIETMEAEQQELYQRMADPAFYQRESGEIARTKQGLNSLECELETAYARWEALEELQELQELQE